MKFVEEHWDISCQSYAALHQWSVKEQEKFWLAVWDFAEIIGDGPGDTIIENEGKINSFYQKNRKKQKKCSF